MKRLALLSALYSMQGILLPFQTERQEL